VLDKPDFGDLLRAGRLGASLSQGYLGLVRLRQGNHQAALDNLHEALSVARELQEAESITGALNCLGEASTATGQPAQGRELHAEALQSAVGSEDRYEAARAQAGLGSAHQALGNHAEAIRHWQLAHDAYASMGTPEAEDLRGLLNS
jgi:tetratricopeptide (TPR) repeat protein